MTAHGVSKQHNKLYLKYINIIDIFYISTVVPQTLDKCMKVCCSFFCMSLAVITKITHTNSRVQKENRRRQNPQIYYTTPYTLYSIYTIILLPISHTAM